MACSATRMSDATSLASWAQIAMNGRSNLGLTDSRAGSQKIIVSRCILDQHSGTCISLNCCLVSNVTHHTSWLNFGE